MEMLKEGNDSIASTVDVQASITLYLRDFSRLATTFLASSYRFERILINEQ